METTSQTLESFNRKWTAFEALVGDIRQLLPGTIMELHLAQSSRFPAGFRQKLHEADIIWRDMVETVLAAE